MRNTAPSLRGFPLLGHLPARMRDPLGLFTRSDELGGVAGLRFAGKTLHVLTDPDAIERVLSKNARNYVKGFGYKTLESVLGRGLLTTEGEEWATQRRRALPAFHDPRLHSMLPQMGTVARDLVTHLDEAGDGAEIDVSLEMTRAAQRVAMKTFLSVDAGDGSEELVAALPILQKELDRRTLSVFPRLWAGAARREFDQALDKIDRFLFAVIADRLRRPREEPDLLELLIRAHNPGPADFSVLRPVRDEIMTLFLAGHETTASALAWTLHLLALHPEAAGRARLECRQALAGASELGSDGIAKLPYTRQVFEESLRLFPPVWLFGRTALESDELGGFAIPAGSHVLVCPYALHRSKRYWTDPERFDPGRFSKERLSGIPKHAYLPFGAGPRACIGARFAHFEALSLLAPILSRFELEPCPQRKVQPEPLITLKPRNGLWLRLRRASKEGRSGLAVQAVDNLHARCPYRGVEAAQRG